MRANIKQIYILIINKISQFLKSTYTKYIQFPMFTNRYSMELMLYVNIENNKHKKVKSMFEILDKNISQEITVLVDPKKDIIICTPETETLKRTIDGSLSLISQSDFNMSMAKKLINGLSVLELFPKLKISVPRGIKVDFISPIISNYYNSFYKGCIIEQKGSNEIEGLDETLPEYLLYRDLRFTIHVDLDQLKQLCKTIIIKKGSELFDLHFSPIYYVGSPVFPSINSTVWVKSTEVYNTFEDIF